MKTHATLAAIVTLGCLTVTTASAVPTYSVTPLGTLGGTSSAASAINANGQVVGASQVSGNTVKHPFLYDGTLHDLDPLGGDGTATAINASGQVVGSSNSDMFLYDGVLHNLGTQPGFQGTVATDISDSGIIVGYSTFPLFNSRAFIYDGIFHDLGLPADSFSRADGINSLGQIVGKAEFGLAADAFLYDGAIHDLGVPGGSSFSEAFDINDNGQIAGYAEDPFLYNGTWHDLGSLNGGLGVANAINAGGQVVGYSVVGAGSHGFLYSDRLYDLNSLIDPTSGWTIHNAEDINDSGWIVGWGTNPKVNHGASQALLLKPIPEPATVTLALLAGGAAGFGACAAGECKQVSPADVAAVNPRPSGLFILTTPPPVIPLPLAGDIVYPCHFRTGSSLHHREKGPRMKASHFLVASVIVAALASGAALATPMYRVTDLTALLGSTYGRTTAINDLGQVAGYWVSPTGFHGFFYDGAMHDLAPSDPFGQSDVFANGLNDLGQVVGTVRRDSSFARDYHAFMYDGAMHDLGPLSATYSNTTALDINNQGQIVGYAEQAGPAFAEEHAFLYDGTMHDLTTAPGATGGLQPIAALSINDAGEVVGPGGIGAYLYDGTVHNLSSLFPGRLITVGDINEAGAVAGFVWKNGDNFGNLFIYDGATHILSPALGLNVQINGMNDHDQIVGNVGGIATSPFLYDGTLHDLNALIDPSQHITMGTISGINDDGWIVGQDSNGRAVLLQPILIPEPASALLALLAGGAAGLAALRRQRNRSGPPSPR